MTYDPYPDSLDGRLLHNWMDYELRRVIERADEQVADALRYSGPNGAAMYRERRRKAERELERRASGRLGYNDFPRIWYERSIL